MKKLLTAITILILLSCTENKNVDIKKLEKHLGTEIIWEYKISNFEEEVGAGNSLKIYDLVFSKNDYALLLKKLDLNNFGKSGKYYYKNIDYGNTRIRVLLITDRFLIRYSEIDL